MLDVRRLRLLVELDRRGTIAAVARALAYSPSAVSQQLSVLEKEAGATLLEPVGRRVQLTAQGRLLVAHAETVLAELEHAQAALAASRGEVTGTVRLAAFQSAALTLVPSALIRLQGEHPRLRVEVSEMEPESSLPELQAGGFDLVVAEEYPGHPRGVLRGLDRQDLLGDRLVLAVPPPGVRRAPPAGVLDGFRDRLPRWVPSLSGPSSWSRWARPRGSGRRHCAGQPASNPTRGIRPPTSRCTSPSSSTASPRRSCRHCPGRRPVAGCEWSTCRGSRPAGSSRPRERAPGVGRRSGPSWRPWPHPARRRDRARRTDRALDRS